MKINKLQKKYIVRPLMWGIQIGMALALLAHSASSELWAQNANPDNSSSDNFNAPTQEQSSPQAPTEEGGEGAESSSPSVAGEQELGRVLFSSKNDIYTNDEIVEEQLFKGQSVFWEVKKDTRYAVISSSEGLDTLMRIVVGDAAVYRDLYRGEDAGIVFTPKEDGQATATVFSAGLLDGSIKAQQIFKERLSIQEAIDKGENPRPIQEKKLGDYLVEVFEFPSLPDLVAIPYSEEATLDTTALLAHRVAKEYRVALEKSTRLYVRMHSTNFDTLVELSDRYGKSAFSDDWSDYTSLVSVELLYGDEYYITATSFDGRRVGDYSIDIVVTDNETLDEQSLQITPSSPRVLNAYSSEYPLDIKKGEFRTVLVQSLDNELEVAFVTSKLEAIHTTKIAQGESKFIPLYAEQDDEYTLLVLNDKKLVTNYRVTLFR